MNDKKVKAKLITLGLATYKAIMVAMELLIVKEEEQEGSKISVFETTKIAQKNICAIMKKLGFSTCNFSEGLVFIHKKDKYVFKFPVLIGKKPKAAITTVVIHRDIYGMHPIMLQPLADVSQKAKKKCHRSLILPNKGKWRIVGEDPHPGNYGMYKGKPVIIDW